LVLGQQLFADWKERTLVTTMKQKVIVSQFWQKKEIPVTWLLKEKKIFSLTHGNAYVTMKDSANKFRYACFFVPDVGGLIVVPVPAATKSTSSCFEFQSEQSENNNNNNDDAY
jgi:hypothetical protein